jgi:hypothetical protein
METKKRNTKAANAASEQSTEKKSGVTLYWEMRHKLGIPKGEILDWRAALK